MLSKENSPAPPSFLQGEVNFDDRALKIRKGDPNVINSYLLIFMILKYRNQLIRKTDFIFGKLYGYLENQYQYFMASAIIYYSPKI